VTFALSLLIPTFLIIRGVLFSLCCGCFDDFFSDQLSFELMISCVLSAI
jgi:hypothetical protein